LRLLLDPAVIDLNAVVFTDVAAPTANGKAQFIAGLFGMPRADSSWYVLGEEFSDPEAARRRAGELTALSDWQTAVKVYVTQSASGTRYTVGWAGNLTLSDAKKAAARISNLAGGAKARVERAPWK